MASWSARRGQLNKGWMLHEVGSGTPQFRHRDRIDNTHVSVCTRWRTTHSPPATLYNNLFRDLFIRMCYWYNNMTIFLCLITDWMSHWYIILLYRLLNTFTCRYYIAKNWKCYYWYKLYFSFSSSCEDGLEYRITWVIFQ